MEDTIIIRREDGKRIAVTAEQAEEGIIITKVGDRTNDAFKRKIIFETMDLDIYKRFVETPIENTPARGIVGHLRRLIK